jgi:hypothetical protein
MRRRDKRDEYKRDPDLLKGVIKSIIKTRSF